MSNTFDGYYSNASFLKEATASRMIFSEVRGLGLKIGLLIISLLWLWLMYTMITSPDSFETPPPPFAIGLIGAFALVFLLLGIFIGNGYSVTTFDKNTKKAILKYISLTNKNKNTSTTLLIGTNAEIELGFFLTHSSKSNTHTPHYYADLIFDDEAKGKIRFADHGSKALTLADTKKVSAFLNLPIRDTIENKNIASGEMEKGIKAIAQKFLTSAIKYDALDYVLENDVAGELELSYYKRNATTGLDWYIGFATWLGTTFVSFFVAVFLILENTNSWLYAFLFVGAISVTTFYFGFIWLFYKITYTLSHDQIIRRKKAPFWNKEKIIDVNTIMEFNEYSISTENGDFGPSDSTALCNYLLWRFAKYYGK